MHGPINVKSPNDISIWQMGFNSAFKGLKKTEQIITMRGILDCKPLRWSRGSVLAFDTQVREFVPGRSRRIFRAKKMFSTPSFGGEVKPSVPCRSFTACKRFLNVTWKSAFRQNYRTFFAHSSTFRRWVLLRGGTRGDAWWRKLERLTIGRTISLRLQCVEKEHNILECGRENR
jgi:hypothetical protein